MAEQAIARNIAIEACLGSHIIGDVSNPMGVSIVRRDAVLEGSELIHDKDPSFAIERIKATQRFVKTESSCVKRSDGTFFYEFSIFYRASGGAVSCISCSANADVKARYNAVCMYAFVHGHDDAMLGLEYLPIRSTEQFR